MDALGADITVVADAESLARVAAQRMAQALRRAVAERGEAHCFLAGGSTPEAAYRALAASTGSDRSLWESVHIYWGDERCVGPDHPASNYAMARRCLLDALALPGGKVHRILGELPDRQEAARRYEACLPPAADLVLLGLGGDGHTASLFPGSPALDETRRRVAAVTAPAEPAFRITVTPPFLAAARQVLVLVSSSGKAEALGRVFAAGGSVEETPARLVRGGGWLVDEAAAAGLSPR